MEFRLLGTVEATAAGQSVYIGQRRERRLLGILLTRLPHPVGVEQFIDLLWGDEAPLEARAALQVHVSRLRRSLADAGVQLNRAASGYTLNVDPEQVDLHRFRDLCDRIRTGPRDLPALLAEAGALYQGPLLGDDGTERLRRALCPWLDELWMSTRESAVETTVRRGGHPLAELAELVAAHPVRERLASLQVLALHRAGRRDEALAAFERARSALADQLGLDPGPELRRAYETVLHTPAVPAPAQLPPGIFDFTGRTEPLAALDGFLTLRGTVVISTIAGTGGVGKTALALHWAHRVRDQFPDGQLYVNLHGHSATTPVGPMEALGRFLRALGCPPEDIPTEIDEAAARYRSLLADRRILVVLDNAHHPDQVRPLLPASPGSMALVTSRDRLVGLTARDGARRLHLPAFTPEESLALLSGCVGAQRVTAEPWAAAELVALCGHLPLAIRIIAYQVTEVPHLPLAGHVARLRADRLNALALQDDVDTCVRATFDLSYAALDPDTARMFRLLGLVPGADFTAEAAGALTGMPAGRARRLLDRLVAGHLVEAHPAGRYAFHDLLREYAAGHGASDPESEASVTRLTDWYLHTALAADTVADMLPTQEIMAHPPAPPSVSPGSFEDRTAALRWLDSERAALVSVVHHCCAHGVEVTALRVLEALGGHLHLRRWSAEFLATGLALLSATTDASDPRVRVLAHDLVAAAYRITGKFAEAVHHSRQALFWLDNVAGRPDEPRLLLNLGRSLRLTGHLAAAADCYRSAAKRYEQDGVGGAKTMFVAGVLGDVYRHTSDFQDSLTFSAEALALAWEVAPPWAPYALEAIANVHTECGRHQEGIEHARAALDAAERFEQPFIKPSAFNTLGSALAGLGRPDEAHGAYTDALRLCEDQANPEAESESLCGLALLSSRTGRHGQAIEQARRAVDVAHGSANLVGEGRARATLAEIRLAAGHRDDAATEARQALAVNESTGHQLGEARSLLVLGTVTGDSDLVRRAHAIYTRIGAPVPS
ncbi:SARP family transcriptional regulator [Longispora fulva]|uniref:DNA-binding SARP family transcriptional activator/tetratricopeptide (TPR) repeat protein n=1 Tax=Longispora fulva TaxID=619741 RepID=A0A8J7GRM5_9ACTN|nr:BTAD domain-containing putative transcriptional regulator [Longispora fulva]MBG6137444.1 DNA-binding SARP family transcriptional activator/tetratricopeptide (TPR) repeat protein [Longispora fulva]GIG61201.1 SARP family transcriptional regulator [Longispora fulva]